MHDAKNHITGCQLACELCTCQHCNFSLQCTCAERSNATSAWTEDDKTEKSQIQDAGMPSTDVKEKEPGMHARGLVG